MIGRLHEDIFNQEKYLLDMAKVRLRLPRSKNQFCFMTNPNFIVKLLDAVLKVRTVHISQNAYLGITSALKENTAKCPMRCVIIKVIVFQQDLCQEVWIMCFVMLSPRELW